MTRQYVNVDDVQLIMGIKQSKAYDILRKLNAMRKKEGFVIVAGQCPRKYFTEKTGYETDELDLEIKKDTPTDQSTSV